MRNEIPDGPAALTPDWITGALHRTGAVRAARVTRLSTEPLGEGLGFLGQLVRAHLTYDRPEPGAPASLVVKFPTPLRDNRQLCHLFRFYEREIGFYAHLAESAQLRTPRCFHHAIDVESQDFVLVLEDLGRLTWGDQVTGCSEAQVLSTVRSIGSFHARYWNRVYDGTLDWVVDARSPDIVTSAVQTYERSLGPALDWLSHVFTPQSRAVAVELAARIAGIMNDARGRPRTLVHGDLRGDNLLFDAAGEVTVVDWQLLARGRGPFDIAYHLSQSVTPEVRRRVEARALAEYHRSLVEGGVSGYSSEECWKDYREGVLFCLVYPISVAGSMDRSNVRGRKLAELMLERSLCAISDNEAQGVLRHVA